MKANELMIGDWVQIQYRNKKVKVTGVHDNILIDTSSVSPLKDGEWEPIPLTAEILNKNFPKPNEDYWVDGDFPIIGYSIPCITDGHRPYVEVSIYDPARVMEFEMFFHYVHELQHALRLCGIEKEIEL